MSESFKILDQRVAGTSNTTHYTVPTGKETIIKHITCLNTHASLTSTIKMFVGGTGAANTWTPAVTLAPGESRVFDGSLTLEAGKTISGVASAASAVSVMIAGAEVDPSTGGGGGGATNLDGLSDVVITSPTSGQVLGYSGSSWANTASGTATTDENRMYALMVTLLRPSKWKWRFGNFGTFTPTERIYCRVLNLCRLGASGNNYMTGTFISPQDGDCVPCSTSDSIVAHGSLSVLGFVTETDVAAVTNAKATYFRMKADLMRTAAMTHYQTEVPGFTPRTASSITTITPSANGSMVVTMEATGYEANITATVGGTTYNAFLPYTKAAQTSAADANVNLNLGSGNPTANLTHEEFWQATVADQWAHTFFATRQVMLPIAATMDSQSITWGCRAYSAFNRFQGWCNVRVAALPSNWNTDA